jgi:hypothetical protein
MFDDVLVTPAIRVTRLGSAAPARGRQNRYPPHSLDESPRPAAPGRMHADALKGAAHV